MTDLITSLRALAAARHDDLSIAVDAVNEIRRLRAEIERQRVENERLRAALIDIARQETTGPYKWQSVVEHLCEIAREALEGEP